MKLKLEAGTEVKNGMDRQCSELDGQHRWVSTIVREMASGGAAR